MQKLSLLLVAFALANVVMAGTSGAAPPRLRSADVLNGVMTAESGTGVLPQAVAARALMDAEKGCKVVPIWSRFTFHTRVGGIMLWRYSQQLYTCFVGGYVTFTERYRFFEIPSLIPGFGLNPWEFKGNVDNSCDDEHCRWSGQADSKFVMTRGQFRACAVPYLDWVCRDVYPLDTITVYGKTGGDYVTYGGGSYSENARES